MLKKKIALVLSGGGARGIAHIGVIEELVKNGYRIHSVAGTSMGAFVGGMYAYGKLEEFKEWLISLDRKKMFKLMDFTFNGQGLIKGDKIFEALSEIIPDTNIEDLPIKYTATAADLNKRCEVVFDKGSLYEAIRASIAIPTVITPLRKGNSLLVDGGVVNNLPITNVTRKRWDNLVVVNVNAKVPIIPLRQMKKTESTLALKADILKRVPHFFKKSSKSDSESASESAYKERLSYLNIFDKTYSLMIHNVVAQSIEKHKPDLQINISRDTCTTWDFLKAEQLIEVGAKAARQALLSAGGLNNTVKPLSESSSF